MIRSLLTRLALLLAVLSAPAVFVGCSEESKPTPAPAGAAPAPAAPSGDAAKPAEPGK